MESETKETNWVKKARPIQEPKGDEPPTPGSNPLPDQKKITNKE